MAMIFYPNNRLITFFTARKANPPAPCIVHTGLFDSARNER